ncbi:MAG TPA: hypothetical protein VHL09_00775 [Dehalococcoidia bacterium]|nr:hypothetical protein [Dehalococcoidia bacterium]
MRWRAEQALAREEARRAAVTMHAGALRQAGRRLLAHQATTTDRRDRALAATLLTLRGFSLRLAAVAEAGYDIIRPPDDWRLGYLDQNDVPGYPALRGGATVRLYQAIVPAAARERYQAAQASCLFTTLVLLAPSLDHFAGACGDPLLVGLLLYPQTSAVTIARQLAEVDERRRTWADVSAVAFWIATWDLVGEAEAAS